MSLSLSLSLCSRYGNMFRHNLQATLNNGSCNVPAIVGAELVSVYAARRLKIQHRQNYRTIRSVIMLNF